MAPPSQSSALHLIVLPEPFFVVKIDAGEPIPPDILAGLEPGHSRFFSITRTNEELSIVGETYEGISDICKDHATWTCIKIKGPMEHDLTGVIASFAAPLKEAKIPVFALSTWNTDYVLVPAAKTQDAIKTLKTDGWIFV